MASTKPFIRVHFVSYPSQGISFPEPSLTKQSFAAECDFNNVLAKWQVSGLISHVNTRSPIFADVSSVSDYQSSIELIRSAQDMFFSLPSSIRDRFANDPARLLAFLSDPQNRAEAVSLGLVTIPTPVDASAPQGVAEAPTGTPQG